MRRRGRGLTRSGRTSGRDSASGCWRRHRSAAQSIYSSGAGRGRSRPTGGADVGPLRLSGRAAAGGNDSLSDRGRLVRCLRGRWHPGQGRPAVAGRCDQSRDRGRPARCSSRWHSRNARAPYPTWCSRPPSKRSTGSGSSSTGWPIPASGSPAWARWMHRDPPTDRRRRWPTDQPGAPGPPHRHRHATAATRTHHLPARTLSRSAVGLRQPPGPR
jgi:hypothetical protein